MGYFVALKTFAKLSQNNFYSSQNNVVYLKELIFQCIYICVVFQIRVVSCFTYCETFQ